MLPFGIGFSELVVIYRAHPSRRTTKAPRDRPTLRKRTQDRRGRVMSSEMRSRSMKLNVRFIDQSISGRAHPSQRIHAARSTRGDRRRVRR